MAKKQIEMAELVVKTYAVQCPACGAKLKVKEGGTAYACPKCTQLFRVRKTEKLVEELYSGPISEAYVSVSETHKGKVCVESVVKEN